MSIIIPVRGSTNTVEVFNDELPDDPADVIDLLRAELAPLITWCEFAVAYHHQGKHEQFREILLGVVDAFDVYEMQDFYRREPALFASGRLRVLNLLAASATSSFIYEELRKDAREAWRQKALEYIGRADKISENYPQTWLVKALFWIGEHHHDTHALRNAAYYADSSIRSDGGISCTARLAKAAILFHQKKYADALRLYANTLRSDPKAAGISARVGIGLCAYHLGDKGKALVALERALTLNPKSVEALVAVAVLRLECVSIQNCIGEYDIGCKGSSNSASMNSAINMLCRARELNPTYSMALNHYANHLFWQWQEVRFTGHVQPGSTNVLCSSNPTELLQNGTRIQLIYNSKSGNTFETEVKEVILNSKSGWVIKLNSPYTSSVENGPHKVTVLVKDVPEIDDLASRAYHCTAVPEIRAEAYFILGRNHHMRHDFDGALPYYTQACKLWPQFTLAQYRLAQVRTALRAFPAAMEAAEAALDLAPDVSEVLRLVGILRLEQQCNDPCDVLNFAIVDNKTDSHTWLALAHALEQDAFTHESIDHDVRHIVAHKAIQAYTNAARLQRERGLQVPYQIANNTGVLYLELGDIISAREAFLTALDDYELSLTFSEDRDIISPSDSPTSHTKDNSHQCWIAFDNEVWLSTFNQHILWINAPIVPPFHIGERIRVGKGDAACVVHIKAIVTSSSNKALEMTNSSGGLKLQENALMIEVSEQLRISSERNTSLPLYRIDSSQQIKLSNSIVPVFINLSQLHATIGDWLTAREIAELALKIAPKNVRCRFLLSSLSLNTKDLDQARKHTDAAVSLTMGLSDIDDKQPDYMSNLLAVASVIWHKLNEYEEARTTLERLRGMFGGLDVFASVSLCELHLCGVLDLHPPAELGASYSEDRVQQLRNAVDCARDALCNDSSCAAAAHALGVVLLELGQLDDAALIFERVQEGTSIIASSSNAHSTSCKRTDCGILQGAGISLDAAINLAHSRLLSGQCSEAAEGYAACARATPVKLTGGIFTLKEVASTQTRRADIHHWLARAHHGTNNSQGAQHALAAAIHMQPNNLTYRCHCAILLLENAMAASSWTPSVPFSSSIMTSRGKTECTYDLLVISKKIFSWLDEKYVHSERDSMHLDVRSCLNQCDSELLKAPTLVASASDFSHK